MLTLVPVISVPSSGKLMLAVHESSFHSKSTESLGVTVAVRLLSSPRLRSHSTERSPSLLMVGATRLSSSICLEMVTDWASCEALTSTLVPSLS